MTTAHTYGWKFLHYPLNTKQLVLKLHLNETNSFVGARVLLESDGLVPAGVDNNRA